MSPLRLTAAQAAVRYLAAQRTVVEGAEVPLFAGVWAIFGHGNVAGLGEALYHVRDVLPRPTGRTTSRAWRTPRSPSPRRSSAAR
jgi:TPP-dependent trihydroxycyclohexane-1,2-dione (THcHDO) dehydratase